MEQKFGAEISSPQRELASVVTVSTVRWPPWTGTSALRAFEECGGRDLERVREAAQRAYREVVRAGFNALEVARGDTEPFRKLLLGELSLCPQLGHLAPKVGQHGVGVDRHALGVCADLV